MGEPRHRSHSGQTKVTTTPFETKPYSSLSYPEVPKTSKSKHPALATENTTETQEFTKIINITMTLSIAIGIVRGHPGEVKPSVGTSGGSIGGASGGSIGGATTIGYTREHPGEVTSSGGVASGSIGGTRNSQGDATTISNKRGSLGKGKPAGGNDGSSIGGHLEGDATTIDNVRLHTGEVKPSGGISGGSIGGYAEGGVTVRATEVPICRTLFTPTTVGSPGQPTVRTAKSPTTLPPITGTSLE